MKISNILLAALLFLSIGAQQSIAGEAIDTGTQTCAYYLGKDPETLAKVEKDNVAKMIGLKLGLQIRVANATQWAIGFMHGHTIAKTGEQSSLSLEEVEKMLTSSCEADQSRSILQAVIGMVK